MAMEEEEGGLTFSLDVGGDGAAALRNTIMNKLSDFMGSYTDDVLAEYVVVLVSHGKQRAQAVKDLEAFLGDQSESFVTWLWEHLGSNMHLYTLASNDLSTKPDSVDIKPLGQGGNEEVAKSSEVIAQWKEKSHDSLPPGGGGRLISLRSKTTEIKSQQDLGSATIRATQVDLNDSVRSLNGSARGAKRQRSPDSRLQSERIVSEKHKAPRVSATMRLLQSAVREAVAPASGHSKRSVREAGPPVREARAEARAPVREARAPVREAKAPVRVSTAPTDSHSKWSESSLKRLQSVVSADFENSEVASVQQPLKDVRRPNAVRQGKKAMPAIMMAMKAAAAAAEDVTKVRGRLTGNIWDRLGKKTADFEDSEDEEHVRYDEENKEAVEDRLEDRYTSHYEDEHDHKKPRLESDDMLSEGSIEDDAVVSGSVFDEYPGQSASSRNVYAVRGDKYHEDERNGEGFVSDDYVEDGEDIRASDRRRRRKEESVTVEYRLARNTDGAKKDSHKPKGSSASSVLANSSQKIVNISVNVNTWKSEAYDKVKDTGGSEQPAVLSNEEESQEQTNKAFTSNMISAPTGNEVEEDGAVDMHTTSTSKPVREIQPEANDLSVKPPTTKEAPKAVSSPVPAGVKPVRKLDDAESRTVFVTNIHFAASKESVMAHFASCGDIGRIVMLTDGATGQPKGSAYIEFKTKEATDRALTLNDSSFYSRALKVVRKDAAIQAIQEMNPLIHPGLIRRPIPIALRLPLGARILRAPPYLVQRRFPTLPRPYGNFPSLQWKRDGPANTNGNVNRPGFNVPVRPVRSNSYVRSSGPQPLKPVEELPAVPSQGEEEIKADGVAKEMGDVQMEQA